MKHTKLGRLFEYMKRRCNNPNCKDYPNYGGRFVFELCIDKTRYRKSGFETAKAAYDAKMELLNSMNVEYGNQ